MVNRKFFIGAIAAGLLVTLTGCMSLQDLQSTPQSVLRTDISPWTNDATYLYTDEAMNVRELSECEWPDMFSDRYCETVDGDVRFTFSLYKGRLREAATLTVNGENISLTCPMLSDSSEQGCVPRD